MASSRFGWVWCWRHCLARSDCRAAVSPMPLGSTSNTGKPAVAVPVPTLPQGRNSISDFIPVARLADSCCTLANPSTLMGSGSATRHQAGLLGRRQPVPPSSGPEPATPRLCASRYGHRPRVGMDGEYTARRCRVAGNNYLGARGYRRRLRRPSAGRDASGGGALWRGARRLRHLLRPG